MGQVWIISTPFPNNLGNSHTLLGWSLSMKNRVLPGIFELGRVGYYILDLPILLILWCTLKQKSWNPHLKFSLLNPPSDLYPLLELDWADRQVSEPHRHQHRALSLPISLSLFWRGQQVWPLRLSLSLFFFFFFFFQKFGWMGVLLLTYKLYAFFFFFLISLSLSLCYTFYYDFFFNFFCF